MKLISAKTKKTLKTVSNIVTVVLFVVLLLFIGVILFQRIMVGEPEFFGYQFFVILTDSMSPEYEVGSVVLSKTVEDPSRLEVGDIVTYSPKSGLLEGRNLTHRIERIYTDSQGVLTVVTKGTKIGALEDDPIPASDVKAVLVRKMAVVGKLFSVLKSPYGFIFLIITPLLIVLVGFIVSYMKSSRQTEDSKKPLNDEQKKELAKQAYLEQLKEEMLRIQADSEVKDNKSSDEQ